jgi:hypothetical protein
VAWSWAAAKVAEHGVRLANRKASMIRRMGLYSIMPAAPWHHPTWPHTPILAIGRVFGARVPGREGQTVCRCEPAWAGLRQARYGSLTSALGVGFQCAPRARGARALGGVAAESTAIRMPSLATNVPGRCLPAARAIASIAASS